MRAAFTQARVLFAFLCKSAVTFRIKIRSNNIGDDVRHIGGINIMFEQLMETEPQAAVAKSRNTYFVLTAATLGITLFTALIISLFAIDLNIGMNEMDMVELVAPVDVQPDVKRPELESEPQPQKIQQPGGGSKAPTRQVIMASVDETPRDVPTTVSTTKNTALSRPLSDFVQLGKADTDPVGGGSGRGTGNGTGNGTGDGLGDGDGTLAKVEDAAPPPPVKKAPAEKPVIQS